jgi:hypothetical protein
VSRRVAAALLLCVAVRVALPLVVLAAAGGRLAAGFPVYRYVPLNGDAFGYYAAARALIAVWSEHARVVVPGTLAIIALAIVLVRRTRGRRDRAALNVVLLSWAIGSICALVAWYVPYSGAATIGWPIVWAVVLAPLRVLHLLHVNVVFATGLTLSLIGIAAIVVGTYALGRTVTNRAAIGLGAAVCFALWPFAALALGGQRGTANGTWQGEIGLSLYNEPLSTALVVAALVLALRRGGGRAGAAVAGALLGFDATVRLSNVLILGVILVALFVHDRARAVFAAAAAAAFAPLELVFWPKGYPSVPPPAYPAHPYSIHYVHDAWAHSLFWRPPALLALVPVAVIGVWAVRREAAAVLIGVVAVTAGFYSFFELTPYHPRFLFVALPAVLVLWCAGVGSLLGLIPRRLPRPTYPPP